MITPPTEFHYGGGGFTLDSYSYLLLRAEKPRVPVRAQIDDRLAFRDLTPDEREQAILTRLTRLTERHPIVLASWERAPYRVDVTAHQVKHPLIYLDAERFLRDIGVLIKCAQCGAWKLVYAARYASHCEDCAYVSADATPGPWTVTL